MSLSPQETQNELTAQDQEPVQEDCTSNVIEVQNPTAEEMQGICKTINAKYDNLVNTQAVEFKFKKSVDKNSGIETIRTPVELAIPFVSVDGIVAILEAGGKGLELLLEATADVVKAAARDVLYDDTKLTAATFPVDKVSWEFIANIPKVQRRGGGIPKTTWDAFAVDYCEVMPTATGKTVAQVANAAKILVGKLSQVRTNEPILTLLVAQLALYTDKSPNIEEFQECVSFLVTKADAFLNTSEEELLGNL